MSNAALEIRAKSVDLSELSDIASLLARSFPGVSHLREPFLKWLYLESPRGISTCVHAYAEGQLVGHAGFSPMRAHFHADIEPGFLVHSVATHPDFTRRGILTQLLAGGLEYARENGAGFVIAVPNDQSVGSFIKRSAFKTLGPLPARLGVGRPQRPQSEPATGFEGIFEQDDLRWRLARPGARYGVSRVAGGFRLEVDTGTFGIRAELACLPESSIRPSDEAGLPRLPQAVNPLYLCIGLDPGRRFAGRPHLNIPLRLRPAPLHFVYQDLRDADRVWSAESVRFRLIDFDGY